jgi:hypothetical protein
MILVSQYILLISQKMRYNNLGNDYIIFNCSNRKVYFLNKVMYKTVVFSKEDIAATQKTATKTAAVIQL